MKKRFFSVLLALVLLLCAAPLPVHAAANEITVYNWGQYISDGTDDSLDVIKAFEEETGIKVNYLTFDSNESMYTKLKTGGTTFDVIIPSDYMIAKLISEDMLEPLDFDNIPNYEYIDEAFRNQAYDPENTYSVPYTWGTVGLIYNKNYVSDEDAESWSCLWNSKYQGKLLMFDNPRDAFAIAESMLGYSFNTEDEQELKNCADLLATQSPVLQGYVMDQIFDRMERGEAWAAPYYAGDYLTMVEENPDLGFSHPKEGFNIFIDAMCIPKGCQNKEGAEAFINFLCRPDISAANLDYIGYSTPETAAKDYLDEEVTSSPVSYPDDETLARSESFAELGVEATQVMNDLWLSVKTSTSNTTLYLILTIAAIAAVILFFVISGIVRRRKKARRCHTHTDERDGPAGELFLPVGLRRSGYRVRCRRRRKIPLFGFFRRLLVLIQLRYVADAADGLVIRFLLRFTGGDQIVVSVERMLQNLLLHLRVADGQRSIGKKFIYIDTDLLSHASPSNNAFRMRTLASHSARACR